MCAEHSPKCISEIDINSVQNLNLREECDRLKTFEKWSVTFLDKRDLAAAGFYYCGQRDAVKCPFCSIGLADWVPGDAPLVEHRRKSPNCGFVERMMTSNRETVDKQSRTTEGEDTCGPFDNAEITLSQRLESSVAWPSVNPSHTYPKYPAYESYDKRLKSFENWPYSYKVPPDTLSLAGFMYTKVNDRTICFHCGLKISRWNNHDDPWIEHAYWSPECKFILDKKGQQFVNEVRVKKREIVVCAQEEIKNAVETCRQLVSATNIPELQTKNGDETSNNADDASNEIQKIQNTTIGQELASCLICLTTKRQTVLLPCYHVVACDKCVRKLKNCCVCREQIIYWRRIYFS